MIEYREWFSKTFNYFWKDDDYVFLSIRNNVGEKLSYMSVGVEVVRITKRAGIKFSIHDGRRIVQTALESVGTSPQWIRKIKGRKVSGEESPYSRPAIEQLRGKYREALGELEFLGVGSVEVNGLSAEKFEKINKLLDLLESGHFKLVP